MGLFWLDLLTHSSTTESPLLLLCGLESVVWMQWSLAGKDNGGSTKKRKRTTMNGVVVLLLLLRRFLPRLFLIVCVCAACCCCRRHRGAPVLVFLRFPTDSSPPSSLHGAGGMMGSEPCVSTTREKIASLTGCPRFCNMRNVRSVLTIQQLMQFSRMRTMAIHTHTDRREALPYVWLPKYGAMGPLHLFQLFDSSFESSWQLKSHRTSLNLQIGVVVEIKPS